jgi:hypothetical protein
MSNAGALNDRPKKSLADMARRRGIRGWDSMDKGALVKALSRPAPSAAKIKKPAKPAPKPRAAVKPVAKSKPKSLPKPAAKSAAKITRPVKPAVRPGAKPAAALRPAPRIPARPAAVAPKPPTTNGPTRPAHSASANGTSRLPAKPAVPATPAKPAVATKPSIPAKPALPTKPGVPGKPTAKPTGKPEGAKAPPVRDLAPRMPSGPMVKDRIILAVNDPYWLHVMWDLSAHAVQRAEAALKQDWYGAKLVIRLSDVTSHDTTSTSETPIRDIPIEGDGRNWYINVPQPPRQYRADIGYLSRRGDFFPVARSNVVTPPKAGSAEALDAGWETDPKRVEKIVRMSTGFEATGSSELKAIYEKKLNRPIGPPKETGFGSGATLPGSLKKFFFEIDAKLIVFGRTDPTAHVTLGNDPIDLTQHGTFVMEFSLPDSRQIIPAVATSIDGVEERTIVLAVERNTKYLDPMIHDQMTEG